MNNRHCFFIGNRHAPSCIKKQLGEVIEKHIVEYNVVNFTVGHYGNFDRLVQCVLRDIKKQYKNIELYLLTPYALNQIIETPEGFNGTLYPEGIERVPKSLAIVQANRLMIQQSSYLITYSHHIGNTQNFIEYAKKREKKGLIKITQI